MNSIIRYGFLYMFAVFTISLMVSKPVSAAEIDGTVFEDEHRHKDVHMTLNDVPLGVILGADFARAVFSIWIGNTPIDESFRDRLLGI